MTSLDKLQSRSSLDLSGRVFDIQKFSIHDGPGIRTTVFLKGCPLRCVWCHNPESQSTAPQVSFMPDKCIGCGYCFRTCEHGGHLMVDDQHVLDRDACVQCFECIEECYAGALERIGKDMTAREVLDDVERDKVFYENSGGGMTLSGGEPTAQMDFAVALLEGARARGISTAMETCGIAPWRDYERLLPLVDLFLYDVKAEPERHKEYTGVDVDRIVENLGRLHDANAAIWLRLPTIPGYNDTEAFFRWVAELYGRFPHIQKVHVLPFHPLAGSKYKRLGLENPMPAELRTPDDEAVEGWLEILNALGVPAEKQ